jgi:lipoprotein-anchoring transpeptidase ErfK/SrfK
MVKISSIDYNGEWWVPVNYVLKLAPETIFTKTIFVDRTNQNITTIEKVGDEWRVRSMNPATTGLHHPPFQKETPLGVFVIQEKKPKMFYTGDGNSAIAGFAPYASRFTRGGYIHGVPVNNPNASVKDYIEFSPTLGTTPRSHMCVRNATSHAKFVYDWAPALGSLVYVLD